MDVWHDDDDPIKPRDIIRCFICGALGGSAVIALVTTLALWGLG